MPKLELQSDVVVIGGGPAGSTVSAFIAKEGFGVQLFERERFPRFHIGESLIPETYWVLERLGMLEKMQKSHFVKKHSVQFAEGIRTGDLSAEKLGQWGPLFSQGVDRMRRLVCEYYEGFSFGQFVRNYPHLTGRVTDLLIGDLFTDRVDGVFTSMEAMYPEGKAPPPPWDAGPALPEPDKANHLILPDGSRP